MKFSATMAWGIGLGFLLASEAFLAYKGRPLLSDAVWGCEGRLPIVPAAIGFCAAHFVWPPGRFLGWLEVKQLEGEKHGS
jgi:hypothetical protein